MGNTYLPYHRSHHRRYRWVSSPRSYHRTDHRYLGHVCNEEEKVALKTWNGVSYTYALLYPSRIMYLIICLFCSVLMYLKFNGLKFRYNISKSKCIEILIYIKCNELYFIYV